MSVLEDIDGEQRLVWSVTYTVLQSGWRADYIWCRNIAHDKVRQQRILDYGRAALEAEVGHPITFVGE